MMGSLCIQCTHVPRFLRRPYNSQLQNAMIPLHGALCILAVFLSPSSHRYVPATCFRVPTSGQVNQVSHHIRLSAMRSMSPLIIFSHASEYLINGVFQQSCIESSAAKAGGSPSDLDYICKSSQFLSLVDACEAQSCS